MDDSGTDALTAMDGQSLPFPNSIFDEGSQSPFSFLPPPIAERSNGTVTAPNPQLRFVLLQIPVNDCKSHFV